MSILGNCPFVPDQIAPVSFIYPNNEPVQCMYVAPQILARGGSCPPAYYCPPYTPSDLTPKNIKTLNSASCVHGSVAQNITNSKELLVVCPCTPGYFCPGNTSEPLICTEGFYCPTDSSITETITGAPIPSTGLGTWGAKSYLCPEGSWCRPAQVVPFSCNLLAGSLNNCPLGSQNKNSTALIVLVALGVGFFYLVFLFRGWRVRKQAREEEQQMEYIQNKIAEELAGFDSQKSEPLAVPQDSEGGKDGYLIEFKDISLTLKNGTTVMKNVSGSFKPGRVCGILGPSGAGT